MRVAAIAAAARALADPKRVQALALLAAALSAAQPAADPGGRPPGLCVAELQEALGLSQPRASYHLAELRRAGLVGEQRQGRQNFYILAPEAVHELAAALAGLAGSAETRRAPARGAAPAAPPGPGSAAAGRPGPLPAAAAPVRRPSRPHLADERPAWLL